MQIGELFQVSCVARYAGTGSLVLFPAAHREPESMIPMKSPFSDPTPPNELAVVGENKNDPSQLLLLGADGHYYAYSLPDGDTKEVDPNDDWDVEFPASQELFS